MARRLGGYAAFDSSPPAIMFVVRPDKMIVAPHVQPWEQFRTIFPPLPYMLVWATNEADQDIKALPIYGRWPNGTFPANIQRDAKARYWLLKSTSRFSVEDIPNKWSLDCVSPAIEPMKFEHIAGMAAVVCIASALHQYESTLSEWAYVVRKKIPGHSFEWLVQHKPALLEALLAEYVSSPANGHENERALLVAARSRCAEAWLGLVNSEDYHQSEIERSTGMATQNTLAQVKAKNTSRARDSAKNPRGQAKNLTEQIVADYFNAHPGDKFESSVMELVIRYGVSERTVTPPCQNDLLHLPLLV